MALLVLACFLRSLSALLVGTQTLFFQAGHSGKHRSWSGHLDNAFAALASRAQYPA